MSAFPLQALFGKGMGWSSFFQKRVNKRSIWTGGTLPMTTLKVLYTIQELQRSMQDSAMVHPTEPLFCQGWKMRTRRTGTRIRTSLFQFSISQMPATHQAQHWVVGKWLWLRHGLYSPRANILGWCSLRITCVCITLVKGRFSSLCLDSFEF